jgi:hypothetical protein
VPKAEFPFRKLISPRIWKHWILAGILAMLGGMLLVSQFETAITTQIPLQASRMIAHYNGVLLFVAGQLGLLVWWIRSRSESDFAGRFHVWVWAATAWFVTSFCVATEVYRLFDRLLLPSVTATTASILGIVVLLSFYLLLLRPLLRDMRDSRISHSILFGAYCCVLLAVLSASVGLHGIIQSALSMVGYLGLLLSMSLHARHVLYVTGEPPKLKRRKRRPRRIAESRRHSAIQP